MTSRMRSIYALRVSTARFQLIVQFAQRYFASHDAVVAYEDLLRSIVPRTCEVDGHDIGSGTINFFVYTAHPVAAYRTIYRRATTRASQAQLRMAYRAADGDTFTNLWPRRDARPFTYFYAADADHVSARRAAGEPEALAAGRADAR